MEVGFILKIAGIGILVSVVSMILSKSGKDEQAIMVTVGGIVVVMIMLVEEIGILLESVSDVFGL
ncbi:MAG: stage III sporulation protein AC [Ruminococcaceae bacterium]|nr:stage III sporulation protein AC [Oscillospiraceae bacterium]